MRRLHLPAQLHGGQQRPFAAHQPAGHLVDREHGRHRQAAFHGLDDAVMVVDVELVARLHQHQVGAHALGVGDHGSGLHAVGLGLVTGGNANRCVGHHGHHAHRPAAQLGTHLLLHRGKVGVEVDEQPVQRAGRWPKPIRRSGRGSASIGACLLPHTEAMELLRDLDRIMGCRRRIVAGCHLAIYFRLFFS